MLETKELRLCSNVEVALILDSVTNLTGVLNRFSSYGIPAMLCDSRQYVKLVLLYMGTWIFCSVIILEAMVS